MENPPHIVKTSFPVDPLIKYGTKVVCYHTLPDHQTLQQIRDRLCNLYNSVLRRKEGDIPIVGHGPMLRTSLKQSQAAKLCLTLTPFRSPTTHTHKPASQVAHLKCLPFKPLKLKHCLRSLTMWPGTRKHVFMTK